MGVQMFCEQCGSKIGKTAKFCSSCGQSTASESLSSEVAIENSLETQSNSLKLQLASESNKKKIDKLIADHWSCMGSEDGDGDCDVCAFRVNSAWDSTIAILAGNPNLTSAHQEKFLELIWSTDNSSSGVAVWVLKALAANVGVSETIKETLTTEPDEQWFRWMEEEDLSEVLALMRKNPSFKKGEISSFKDNFDELKG
jgi:hypothetical protein